MSEEKKDISVELPDEAVEEVTGGASFSGMQLAKEFICSHCRYTCMSVSIPEKCPRCGYQWK